MPTARSTASRRRRRRRPSGSLVGSTMGASTATVVGWPDRHRRSLGRGRLRPAGASGQRSVGDGRSPSTDGSQREPEPAPVAGPRLPRPGPRRRRQLGCVVARGDRHAGPLPGDDVPGDLARYVASIHHELVVRRAQPLRDRQGRVGHVPVHRAGLRDRRAEGTEPRQRPACTSMASMSRPIEPASIELGATDRRRGTVVVVVGNAHRQARRRSGRAATPGSTSTRSWSCADPQLPR